MLLLNAEDDPIVPSELHYIPRQLARMSNHCFYSACYHTTDEDASKS